MLTQHLQEVHLIFLIEKRKIKRWHKTNQFSPAKTAEQKENWEQGKMHNT